MEEVSRELTLNYTHISTGQVRGSKRAFDRGNSEKKGVWQGLPGLGHVRTVRDSY